MDAEKNAGLILVVEDAFDLCDLVTAVLEIDLSVRTARAHGGERAVELVQTLVPDLVILDMRALRLDRLEVARRLKADSKTRAIPLVAMGSELGPPAAAAGFDYHFTKPSDLVNLVGMLRRDIDARLLRQHAA